MGSLAAATAAAGVGREAPPAAAAALWAAGTPHVQRRRQGGRQRKPRYQPFHPAPRTTGGTGTGTRQDTGLRLLSWNVSGLRRSKVRELELRHLLDRESPDVAVLTETELDKMDDSFVMTGYKTFSSSTTSLGKIRVLLLLRQSLPLTAPPSLLAANHQEIWIRVPCTSGSWTIAGVYRQWGRNEAEDLGVLCDNIRSFSSSSSFVVLTGDLNFDAARQGDSSYYRRNPMGKFMDVMLEMGFRLENDKTPTFYSHGTFGGSQRTSVLDLVFTLGLAQRPVVQVLPDAATDHRPVRTVLPVKKSPSNLKVILRRDFKRVSPTDLLMHVNAKALSAVFLEEDVDKIAETIVGEVTKVLDVLAPLKQIKVKDSSAPPLYLQRSTRRLMRDRDLAAQKRDWPLFRRLRNLTARQVRKDRLQSNQDLLTRCGGDAKQVWQLANSLTGRTTSSGPPPSLESGGRLVQGEDKLAEIINEFFIEKVQKIRAGIDKARRQQQQRQEQQQQERRRPASSPSSTSSTSAPSSSFQLRPPSERDVLKALNGLRNTPALGEDGIPIKILKDLALVLASPLAHLARRSFKQSKVPKLFKTANVIPILKRSKNAASPSSYRPVALLTSMSKVLEALVLQQFSPHLEKKLPPEQWGFRRNRSTSAALATAQGHWARLRATGAVIGVAAFDYSSAFDTLGVQELVSKLVSNLGVGAGAALWFEDYLSGRQQRVRLGEASSGLRMVSLGVPQGSLLGPSLFIALTSDLPSALGLDKAQEGISIYADDCCLWTAHKDPNMVRIRLEEISGRLADYSLHNSLSLNPGKTQVLWIGGGALPPSTNIGGTLVAPTETLQLLGLSFDRRLTLNPHLQALVGVAGSLHALARRLLIHLPRGPQVQDVVRSLVMGRLCYGAALFPLRLSEEDPLCQHLNAVQVRINDIARLLLGTHRADKTPVIDLLAATKMPSLNRHAVRTTIIELWKCLHSCDGPDGEKNPLGMILSSPSQPVRLTRAAAAGDLPPPPT